MPHGSEIAEAIKPLDIPKWLRSLSRDKNLAWTSVAKIRGVMLSILRRSSCMTGD